jgi:chemotaxis protein CheD
MPTEGRPHIFLLPGFIRCSATPEVISTLLGSCVAVCLWDDQAKAGGITHYLLPESTAGQSYLPRYGNVAISMLVENLVVMGARMHQLKAKVFGGASLISALHDVERIGERNVQMALHLLEELGIPVVSQDIGGHRGRRLMFFTDIGKAMIRKI